jgi:hypothetical protein
LEATRIATVTRPGAERGGDQRLVVAVLARSFAIGLAGINQAHSEVEGGVERPDRFGSLRPLLGEEPHRP